MKKGLAYGVVMVFLVGLQPVISTQRNQAELDPWIFATMTCLIECLIFFPLVLQERKNIRKLVAIPEKAALVEPLLHGWKKNLKLLVYIGINFGVAQILFFLAFDLAGEINGALAQKTSVIFSLLFGFLVNKEKVTKLQIAFSGFLLFGLVLAITQGQFNLLEINLGVLVMMVTAAMWMLAHSITKPMLDRHESTPRQLVFVRNGLSGLILFVTYLFVFPVSNLAYLLEPENIVYFVAMGFVYGFDLFCWYKVLYYLGVSKAGIVGSPTPIATAFFMMFLGKFFTIFHFVGMVIIITSIYFIIREKDRTKDSGGQDGVPLAGSVGAPKGKDREGMKMMEGGSRRNEDDGRFARAC
ncbi:MAG: DMT family transporter [Promethearchaeota archaeon]